MPALLDRLTRRLRGGGRARDHGYAAYLAGVEPRLAARPRVHRFAAVPVVGNGDLPPAPVAVAIDTAGGGDVGATRDSLAEQTVAPVAVTEGDGPGALAGLRVERVAVVAAGDRLAAGALERLGQAAVLAPGAALVTCDDDVLDDSGRRRDPRCRPGPSPDLMAAVNLADGLLLLRPESVEAGPAWRYELALRLAGPDGAGHAHVPLILCHRPRREPPDDAAEAVGVERALAAGEPGARVERLGGGRRRVRRPLIGEPAVEAIVCFRDRPDLLEPCARSLLATSWERLSLRLVDNSSADPRTAELLERLARDARVTVDRDARPFNFAALNNAAAARSSADVLAFVNNDVEAPDPDWLEALLEEALRPEVGAVGPLLCYPDGRVQHAGAAIGLHGWAGHPFAGLGPGERTPFGAAADGTRNWLAVTAACLVVERRKLEAVGGFDEGFAVGGNDVDLCLRLTAAGHRSLCVPHVALRHDESATRDPADIPEADYLRSRERYGAFRTVGDPFYNPSLTLAETSCRMRSPADLPE